jgi:hypothetical protein
VHHSSGTESVHPRLYPLQELNNSQDDASELDIEAVTKGTSLVNNTINYTTQPSVFADGTRIPNATLSIPLADELNTNIEQFHEHRFDCDRDGGALFYLDGKLMQRDAHNVPKFGGNLQLKLWADGNKWWSGQPSSTTVTMSVKNVIAYFNTSGTEDGSDMAWFTNCANAGGPSDRTICKAYAEIGKDDNIAVATSSAGMPAPLTTSPHFRPVPTQQILSDNDLRPGECWTKSGSGSPGIGPCKTSQARRMRPVIPSMVYRTFTRRIPLATDGFSRMWKALAPNYRHSSFDEKCCEAQLLHPHQRSDEGNTVTLAFPVPIVSLLGSNHPLHARHHRRRRCTAVRSQASRNRPFGFEKTASLSHTLQRALSLVKGRMSMSFTRDKPTYTLPFGSPVDNNDDDKFMNEPGAMTSQSCRVRPPSWYNTFYVLNSSRIIRKPNLVTFRARSADENTKTTGSTGPRGRVYEGKEERDSFTCSTNTSVDLVKWWQCLGYRLGFDSILPTVRFLLTNGLIQALYVPVLFAWIFYVVET